MKTDPNEGCKTKEERLIWALIHDGICHPLMALTGYAKWAISFHNFTSHRAWPREKTSHKETSPGSTVDV